MVYLLTSCGGAWKQFVSCHHLCANEFWLDVVDMHHLVRVVKSFAFSRITFEVDLHMYHGYGSCLVINDNHQCWPSIYCKALYCKHECFLNTYSTWKELERTQNKPKFEFPRILKVCMVNFLFYILHLDD